MVAMAAMSVACVDGEQVVVGGRGGFPERTSSRKWTMLSHQATR